MLYFREDFEDNKTRAPLLESLVRVVQMSLPLQIKAFEELSYYIKRGLTIYKYPSFLGGGIVLTYSLRARGILHLLVSYTYLKASKSPILKEY
jgi:hypothetical protein